LLGDGNGRLTHRRTGDTLATGDRVELCPRAMEDAARGDGGGGMVAPVVLDAIARVRAGEEAPGGGAEAGGEKILRDEGPAVNGV